MICKKCGTKMEMERDNVYASLPPQYGFKCPKCGAFEYSTTPEYDDVIGDEAPDAVPPSVAAATWTLEFKIGDHVWAKQPKELAGRTGYVNAINFYRREYDVVFDNEDYIIPEDDLKLVDPATEEARQPVFERAEGSGQTLTEQAAYDEYQERSKVSGDRAEQLAWAFIFILCAQLISGLKYAQPYIIAAGGIGYMLLSSLQSLWQAVTMWMVKQRIRKGYAYEDYPSWVGGGAWVFYYGKMAVITVTAVYAIYTFSQLI